MDDAPKLHVEQLDLFYGDRQALRGVTMSVRPRAITALIGPSGCGKSSLLRTWNRMNDVIPGCRVRGRIELDGRDVHAPGTDVEALRKRVGMVFQRPCPFPLSVRDNVAFGPAVHALARGAALDDLVASSLRAVGLWGAVEHRLSASALSLSAEQQQRLCIARVLAAGPEVLLMDEPCSALDPAGTLRVEELMQELCERYTIVVVTHNMQQAARVSHDAAFMRLGELVEMGATSQVFTAPRDERTEDYISGRYG